MFTALKHSRYLLWVVFFLGSVPAEASGQIVVVVPSKSEIDTLSFKDLQKIFKGQRVKALAKPCQVVEFAPLSDAFYKKLYDLDAYTVGKHWLRLIFSGERVLAPKNFSEIDNFLKYLKEHANAIGFLRAEAFDKLKGDPVRAVVIEGFGYQDARYILRDSTPNNRSSKSQ